MPDRSTPDAAFIRDGDTVFRTYFINARGDEAMGSAWSYLDITALGRQEEWEDSPEGYPRTPPGVVVELARRIRQLLARTFQWVPVGEGFAAKVLRTVRAALGQ